MREKKKLSFTKDIRHMMYGFGDVKTPRYDTAEQLELYVCEYLKNLLVNTMNMAKIKGKTKTDDLLWMLRKDRLKYTRVRDLLATNEELKSARKLMDYEEYEKE